MDRYTLAWIRIIKLAKFFSFLPWNYYWKVGSFLGKYFSFLLYRKDIVFNNFRTMLSLNSDTAKKEFYLLCQSTGVAMCMIEKLPYLPVKWLEDNVRTSSSDALDFLVKNGGVIFSHHSFHHNLLMSYFKVKNKAAYPVVNPPQAFSKDDYLYHWTIALNEATQTNLCGGKMLYVDDKKKLFEDIETVLNDKGILIVLCDFNSSGKSSKIVPFLGKELRMPMGILNYMEEKKINAFFAGFHWENKGYYTLELSSIGLKESYGQSYTDHLEQYIKRYPKAWQNWNHF